MLSTVLAIISVLLLGLAIILQRQGFVIQYVFFLRFPLLIALFMVLLPFLAGEDSPRIIQNWFELDFTGMVIVTCLSILLAGTVMYAAAVLFIHIAKRNDLPFWRSQHEQLKSGEDVSQRFPDWFNRWWFPISGLLAVPIVMACWRRSTNLPYRDRTSAILLGILCSLLFVIVAEVYHHWRKDKQSKPSTAQKLEPVMARVLPDKGVQSIKKGLDTEHDSIFRRGYAFVFFAVAFIIYIIGFFLLQPDRQTLPEAVPAIAYVLVLLMTLALVLSALSLLLDKYRVPVLLLLLVYLTWQYKVSDIDHYYKIDRSECPKNQNVVNYRFTNAYDDWAKQHAPDTYPTIVVVAASGGGITAALWTAHVLSNLQRDVDLKHQFGDSITMISAVSGSAVGSTYVINAFTSDGAPKDDVKLQAIKDQAARSSLGAVGWGLIYPDFWRALPTFFLPKELDRGWALEKRWGAGIIPAETSMRTWQEGIRQGWRPVPIFNATVSETGERLVITPVDLLTTPVNSFTTQEQSPDFRWPVRKLLYPGDDIAVLTAARLSATFPYVTPMARPDATDNCQENIYHVADGGYTDNFGILSALGYLREIEGKLQAERRKVVLVQIRASNPDTLPSPENNPSYFSMATGPFKTLLRVRTPVQVARNTALVEALRYEWQQKQIGQLDTVIFQLNNASPLSWHLSPTEIDAVQTEWVDRKNHCELVTLKRLLGVTGLSECL
jgi:Patatin-like phospholipase.